MKLTSCLTWLASVFLALPLAASATIYKWTDERGTTVFSSKPPADAAKVSNVQVVVEDEKPADNPADKPIAAPKPANGNDLQERVRALEQQVQTLQSQASAQVPNYAAPNSVPLPPTNYYPPPADYYPPQYYPSAYPPPMYGYGYPPMYGYGYPYYPYAYPSVVVVPGRVFRPVHGFGAHRFGVRPVPVTHVTGVARRR